MLRQRSRTMHCLLAAAWVLVLVAYASGADAQRDAAGKLADAPAFFVTLGTGGGPILQTERGQPANAVVVGEAIYLFDTGDGTQREMVLAHLPLAKVRAIFLSHHHIDHNAGLAPLLLARWLLYNDSPLPVVGPPGTKELLQGIAAGYRVSEVARLGTHAAPKPPIAATLAGVDMPPEMNTPQVVYADENFRVLAITNDHYHFTQPAGETPVARSYSFRIETAHRVMVYSGDTGSSPHLLALAQGADLLVTEAIDLDRAAVSVQHLAKTSAEADSLMGHMREDHLTPEAIGRMAEQARVKQLVLTHLSGARDGEKDFSHYTLGIDKSYHGPVHIANDLDRW